jgi:hypothetical protein
MIITLQMKHGDHSALYQECLLRENDDASETR